MIPDHNYLKTFQSLCCELRVLFFMEIALYSRVTPCFVRGKYFLCLNQGCRSGFGRIRVLLTDPDTVFKIRWTLDQVYKICSDPNPDSTFLRYGFGLKQYLLIKVIK